LGSPVSRYQRATGRGSAGFLMSITTSDAAPASTTYRWSPEKKTDCTPPVTVSQ
jgi:hypothetical protein